MPQSVQDLLEVASDDEGEGHDESSHDPDKDYDTDSVIDALQRDLEEPNPIAVRRRRRLVLVQGPRVHVEGESLDSGSVGDVPAARDDPHCGAPGRGSRGRHTHPRVESRIPESR